MSTSPRRSIIPNGAVPRPITPASVTEKERSSNPVSLALGKHLKALRISRQLSQEEMADKAEVDRTLVSRIERGVANPSLMTLSVICYVLDISLSELMTPIKKNLMPQWADPTAPIRRQNRRRSDKPSTGAKRRLR
ncbi:helix-turn-helix domain-containing protein [Variovorax sp. LjRoot175]|uniref:helix-turn-helix domain-containing protein n=1 Tax=Variovorax sp. LjRoot175 TaxID=3342276 RepID=UPI003ED0FD35